MIKQISIMSLATVMLFGCATATKVNQAEINKHPITKVCIQDNRHSPLTNYIKEAVDHLGIQTEVYKVNNNLNPSDDCSHLLSYVYKYDGYDAKPNQIAKVTYFFYNYYPNTLRKRVGTSVDDRQKTKKYIDLNNKEETATAVATKIRPFFGK